MPITSTELVGKIAGMVTICAYIPYIIAILRRKTSPNRATWFIWSGVSFLILSSYYFSGAKDTIWLPLAYAVGSSVIATLSVWYGEGGWTKFDRLCLIGAGVSALLWPLKIPQVVLFASIITDFFGMMPTIKKAYLKPGSENKISWAMFFSGSVLNVIAVDNWNFSIALYPVYLVGGLGIIILFLFLRHDKR